MLCACEITNAGDVFGAVQSCRCEAKRKIAAAKQGKEGVSDTSSTEAGSVAGWFMEAGNAGDFQKASDAFKKAATIVDRLATDKALAALRKSQ
jgi:hypothetical protein